MCRLFSCSLTIIYCSTFVLLSTYPLYWILSHSVYFFLTISSFSFLLLQNFASNFFWSYDNTLNVQLSSFLSGIFGLSIPGFLFPLISIFYTHFPYFSPFQNILTIQSQTTRFRSSSSPIFYYIECLGFNSSWNTPNPSQPIFPHFFYYWNHLLRTFFFLYVLFSHSTRPPQHCHSLIHFSFINATLIQTSYPVSTVSHKHYLLTWLSSSHHKKHPILLFTPFVPLYSCAWVYSPQSSPIVDLFNTWNSQPRPLRHHLFLFLIHLSCLVPFFQDQNQNRYTKFYSD